MRRASLPFLAVAFAPAWAACDAVLGIPDPVRAADDSGTDSGDAASGDAASDAGPPGWYPLPEVPTGFSGRTGHSAVWTGSEMIVWGGADPSKPAFFDGAAFDPLSGKWRMLPEAPLEGRWEQVTAWTGKYMLVWGGTAVGTATFFADGAAYDPKANAWILLPPPPATFEGRYGAVAAWSTTTNELVIWGGRTKGGSPAQDGMALRVDPDPGFWRTLAGSGEIEGRSDAPTVWMGARLVFIGGDRCYIANPSGACTDGAIYDPKLDVWQRLSPLPSVFDGPLYHVGLATGDGHATFWGGWQVNASLQPIYSSAGATFNDALDDWSAPLPDPAGAFEIPKRQLATAWYGAGKMFIWGGQDADNNSLATGGAFDFQSNAWSALPNDGPSARNGATAVWTGSEAILFGGIDDQLRALGDGKVYRP